MFAFQCTNQTHVLPPDINWKQFVYLNSFGVLFQIKHESTLKIPLVILKWCV